MENQWELFVFERIRCSVSMYTAQNVTDSTFVLVYTSTFQLYIYYFWPKHDAIFTQFDCFGAKNGWQFKACLVASICNAS